jgi:hypothetical protein
MMSHPVKLTLFVLAFNVMGFAEGYLLRELGLLWVVPILIVTAFGAVLLSRRWLTRANRS